MKVIIEYIEDSEREKETWYYVKKIDYDPVYIHLLQDQQNIYLPVAQMLRMQIEEDPDILIF